MQRWLTLISLLVAIPASADCIANGHYTVVGDATPLRGTRFPYTEDLVHGLDATPVGARVEVAYNADLRWVKIQSGCAEFAERNVTASAPVNLMLRASLRLAYTPYPTAPADARYEVQLRLGKTADDPDAIVAATELRHVGSHVPRGERFSALVRDLPAGNYVYSMWFRLLDGPESNSVHVDLQWITAQGVPRDYPSAQSLADGIEVGSDWTAAGDPMTFESRLSVDVALQSSFRIEGADGASKLSIAYTVDDEAIGENGTIAVPEFLPEGSVSFDDKRGVKPGQHRIQLWMRSDAGVVFLGGVRSDAVSMPRQLPWLDIIPMQRASASDPVVVTADGDAVQPAALGDVCGRWAKVLQFELPRSSGDFSWTIGGYVEFKDFNVSGYGQVGVLVQHRRAGAPAGADDFDAATDVGMFEFQALPGGDGIYFYGDCSKWGNDAGSRVSLWVRRMRGCGGGPDAGELVVGRRWVSVKLLPSLGPHLP